MFRPRSDDLYVPFSPDELSREILNAVSDTLESDDVRRPGRGGGSGLVPEFEQWPSEWLLQPRGVQASVDGPRESPEIKLQLRLDLAVRQQESLSSWYRRKNFARRSGLESAVSNREERTVFVMSGRLAMSGPAQLDVDSETLRARVNVGLAGTTLTPTGGSLFTELARGALSSEIAVLVEPFAGGGSPPVEICPEIAIPAPRAQRLPSGARHAAHRRHHGLTRVGAGLEKCV
jgi:hypothetical protein